MPGSIEVRGWIDRVPTSEFLSLRGQVIQTFVAVKIGPEGVGLGDMTRFARVLSVQAAENGSRTSPCPRCGSDSAHSVLVEWEAGYESPDGDSLCDECVIGVVVQGAEEIAFGPDAPRAGGYGISLTTPLTDDEAP